MLLLLFAPQGSGAAPVLDLRDVAADLWPLLNASGAADLEFWTEDELYRYFDDASKRLARNAGGFVVRDTSINTVVGTAEYTLPARHLSTIHVSLATAALRAATVEELEALDESWRATQATPERYVQTSGVETVRLYPKPGAIANLRVIEHEFPAAVSPSSPGLNAPRAARDYWLLYALAEARGKESKGAMPEVSAWLRQFLGMYEDAAREYWGAAQ